MQNPSHSSNHLKPGMLNSIRDFSMQQNQYLSKMIASKWRQCLYPHQDTAQAQDDPSLKVVALVLQLPDHA